MRVMFTVIQEDRCVRRAQLLTWRDRFVRRLGLAGAATGGSVAAGSLSATVASDTVMSATASTTASAAASVAALAGSPVDPLNCWRFLRRPDGTGATGAAGRGPASSFGPP